MKQNFTNLTKLLLAFAIVIIPLFSLAQTVQVKGKITDATTSLPIDGATILVKNSKSGTSTNADGEFSLSVPNGTKLFITFIGYETQTVSASESFLSIQLSAENKQLSDVVVTALGVKKEVKKIGYSVQEVKGEDLVKARDQNPISGLTGKVAGLSVGPSAELLRKPTVLLRGNEISLYVVDGIPISSDTWNISPDDIESYTILKGPAAAALYGSRAQNGAIVISTKKGNKNGRKGFTVEINSTNSIDKGFLAFPRLQDEYGPGENGLYAFGNGKGGGKNDNDYDVWGPRFEGQLIPQYDGEYTPNTSYKTTYPNGIDQDFNGNIKPTPWLARGKNNMGNFLQTGFQTTNNIALNANGENYSMRFSLSHSYQQSIIPNNHLNITDFNMYGSFNPTKRLKIEANLNYNRQYTPNFPDVDYGPNSLLYNIAVWTGADWDVNAPDIKGIWKPGKVGTESIFAEYQRYHNPWFMVKEWTREHYKNDIYGYLSANFKINENLNATARTQITTYNLLRTEKMPFSAHPYGRGEALGDYREDRRDMFENNTEFQLNYKYKVRNFVELAGLVGGNIRSFAYKSNFTSTDYLVVPNVYSFSNSMNAIQANSFTSDMRVISAYGSLDASFGKFATVSVTGRVDKSSALPKNSNSYFYPSVSVASVISDYITMPDAISFFKIRGSFAAVHGDATSSTIGVAPFTTITALGTNPSGNSLFDYPLDYGSNYASPYGGPDYSLSSAYSTSKPYNNQTAAAYTSNLYDPNIKTFNRVSFEQGFDIKFLKNRLGFSATAYQYIDGPRILQNPISSATGFDYYYLNALKTKKNGYEFSLSGTPIKNARGISWDVMVNVSTFQDKYSELPPGQTIYNNFFKKGDRVDKFYTSAFVKTNDGQIVHDTSGIPLANPVARYIGNLNADYQWSVYNKVSYKGLSIGFQFDGSVGGVTTDVMHNKTMRGGRNIETTQGAYGAARLADYQNSGNNAFPGIFVGEGVVVADNTPINYDSKTGEILNYKDLRFIPNTKVTHIQPYISKYYNISEANLMSKTFAKLREVTINYDLPAKWLTGTFISKVSVSLVGRNLLYFYKDDRFKDVDLDQYNYSQGETQLQSPTTRRFGFNLNVVF